MDKKSPIARDAYEALAERYAELAESKAENGFIEHPAMRKQIGEVTNLTILDAGCGPGFLSDYLYQRGAERVVSFDVTPKMVELAKKRLGVKANCYMADMAAPLPFVKNEEFDLVVSSLAIDYVFDWSTPLGEFYRALKSKGRLVFSIQHPLGAYLWYKPKSAFGVQYVESFWRGFGGEAVCVPDYYRSFGEVINPILKAGFEIKEIVETRPIEALKDYQEERFKKYEKLASFMILDLQKK